MKIRAKSLIGAFLLTAASAALCLAQPTPANNADNQKLIVQLRAAANEEEQQVLINAQANSDLNAVCALLADENQNALSNSPSEKEKTNARIIKNIAAKTADADCRANALVEAALTQNDGGEGVFPTLREALALFEATGNKKRQGYIFGILFYLYRSRADYEKALEYGARSVKIHEEIKDYKYAVEFLNGIGAVNMYLGNFGEAERAHLRALQIAEENRLAPGIANSAFHLGIIYRVRGNYSDSLRVYQRARLTYETVLSEDPERYKRQLSTCLRHIGLVYYLQGSNALALEYYYKSLAIDESFKDKNAIAYSLLYIARVRFVEKDYKETLALAERALTLYRETADKEGTALALNLLAYTNQKLGNSDAALDYFKQSLAIREATGSKDGAAVVQTGMASVYQSTGKHLEAVELARKAATRFEQSGNRELLWQADTILGKSLLALGERDEALKRFVAATNVIEALRRDAAGSENERGIFFASKVEPYQQTALILAESDNASEAFAASERAKARVLLDVLKFGRLEQSARLTDAERADENRLRGEIASLNAQLFRVNSNKAINAKLQSDLQTRLEKARLAYADFQTYVFANHPELKLGRGAIEPIKTAEIATLLDDKTAFLEYLVTDDATLLFVFTKEGEKVSLKTYRVAVSRTELAARLARFRQMLAESNLLFGAESRGLYDLLMKPAASQIKNKTNLIIVPDDGLWELPFQALQSSENRYVLEDAAISYAPSLTILRELRQKPAPRTNQINKLLAFGNPSAQNTIVKTNFTDLPEATRQTLALRGLYGARNSLVFTGDKAGEDVFKKIAGQFSIVHLATHGVLDNSSPLNSYVLLAPGANGDDGKLEASEILQMNLPAEMVVLSACETARGQARSGEGLIGLAWSLMVAGTRTVVVSQWKVESSSTTDLMTEFHKILNADPSPAKAEALRQAALKLRRSERFAHPFYWAGFVAVGDAR